jgi:hypothetical protein
LQRSVSLYSAQGIGAPWKATSYVRVDATTAYVLWTRSDNGRGVIWKVNPSAASGIPPVIPLEAGNSANLYSAAGVGAPWQATSFEYVDAGTAYVLWTRSDNGRGVIWKIDPGAAAGNPLVIPLAAGNSADLYSKSGIGARWEAQSYAR